MSIAILGISAYYHDSAASIIIDGEIIAAAHEERFTRVKQDSSFPINAIKYVIRESGIDYNNLTAISFYEKPYIKFERLLETYHAFAPKGLLSFYSAIPVWIKEKLYLLLVLLQLILLKPQMETEKIFWVDLHHIFQLQPGCWHR